MMNLLCAPNAIPAAGVAVGAVVGIIWSTIDPRFNDNPQDPTLSQVKYQLGKLIVALGAGVGGVIGFAIDHFIRHMC
jgi:hypothetical protein